MQVIKILLAIIIVTGLGIVYPFVSPQTTKSISIRYSLPHPGFIIITIYDKPGRVVQMLVNELQNVGEYNVARDGRNCKDELISSGGYFYTLQTSNDILIFNRMILLKWGISRQIRADWQDYYCRNIVPLETFVEQARFNGTGHKAANWRHIGQTTGHGRNDRYRNN